MEKKQNRLSIYRNKRKKEDTHPDLNGILYISESLSEGKYNIALYSKFNPEGEKYYSGIVKLALPKPPSFHETKDEDEMPF